ncbi:hypothetical protein OGAPHI_006263 [Ogataea philodendri]|uniref:DH domain-containing protein n=1 Tax=Ogataea philodendri TaxID=1378263 RepID=A0A9P8NZI4_9ASCO|nr:uncharacterized protein OGAPHI_006263 [Ogataea philodendri]KAH3662082.1 hypothetical protein OGAPHI_006263 [Ogataea philodendri]
MSRQTSDQVSQGGSTIKPSFYSSFNESNPIRRSSSQYMDDLGPETHPEQATEQYWRSLLPNAVYFEGDDVLFGKMLSMVYQNQTTKKLSSMVISAHGQTIVDSMSLGKNSKYYPAIQNLQGESRKSSVRKALAVSNLRTFATLKPSTLALMTKVAKLDPNFDWDETMAGKVASEMKLIDNRAPADVGEMILKMGFAQQRKQRNSHVIDVIYSNLGSPEETDKNNELAFFIGEQLEHLFDPLTEYSPEPTEKAYKPPFDGLINDDFDDVLIKSICNELVNVQTNFTVSLVHFLQKFLIPLRVDVLEGKIPNYTTAKLNQIFPPTIDEVTRINCIYLDVLKAALPYGSFEMLRASGTTIPYFYKAHMRHEAATKNFLNQLDAFLVDLQQIGYQKLTYDQKTIQSIMNASLNLPKLQLILDRLVSSKKWPHELQPQVDEYYQSCTNTIIAFGKDKLAPYNHRIFTPTGKILTELASGWPSDLQYGWLTRRVVAIFDIQNVLKSSVKNNGVMIIFSDHVVTLEIVDDSYYYEQLETTRTLHKPSIADILMHSLVNEVPFSSLPKMRVDKWCEIDSVEAQFYNYKGAAYVQLFNQQFIGVYEVAKYTGSYVIEVLNKAKILNKSQPFHLFRSNEGQRSLYYTAHELESYKMEEMKSSFAVFLNMPFDKSLLKKYSIFGFLTLNFDSDRILIEGASVCHKHVKFDVSAEQLSLLVLEQVYEMLDYQLSYENPIANENLYNRHKELMVKTLKVINSSQEARAKELKNIKKAHELLTEKKEELPEMVVSKPRSDSLDMLNNNRVSSTKITKPKTASVPFFKRIFRRKRASVVPVPVSKKASTEEPKKMNTVKVVPAVPKATSAMTYQLPAAYAKRRSSDRSTIRQVSAAESDNLVDSFGLNIDKVRPEKVRATVPAAPAAAVEPPVDNAREIQLQRYFSEARRQRAEHEKNIKERGISAVVEQRNAPLNSRGLLFSPSVTAKLQKLGTEEPGDNWAVMSSRKGSMFEADRSIESMVQKVKRLTTKSVGEKNQEKHHFVVLRDARPLSQLPAEPKKPSARVVTPVQAAHEKFKQPEPEPEPVDEADMFGDIDLTSSFDVSLPDLTEDVVVSDNTQNDKSEEEEEDKFFTPREPPAEVFEQSTTTVNDVDQTSLCSALQEMKDNTVGEVLVDVWTDKRFMSSSSLYTGILNDESYAYLAPLLAGNVTVDGAATKSKENLDYDTVFARNLKDSSLKYLATLIDN